jgi:hypothetical protein
MQEAQFSPRSRKDAEYRRVVRFAPCILCGTLRLCASAVKCITAPPHSKTFPAGINNIDNYYRNIVSVYTLKE